MQPRERAYEDGLESGSGAERAGPSGLETSARPHPKSIYREVLETIVLTLLIFLLVRSVVQNFKVEGYSMEPSLHTNQYLLVNKALYFHFDLNSLLSLVPGTNVHGARIIYPFHPPLRGDIIVFEYPQDPSRDFIKRVIGLPGETVEIKGGKVYVDGQALVEPYIKDPPRYTMSPLTVPPDELFVLGDNRNSSSDSHSWGMLPEDRVIGKAWISYWPRDAFGFLPHYTFAR